MIVRISYKYEIMTNSYTGKLTSPDLAFQLKSIPSSLCRKANAITPHMPPPKWTEKHTETKQIKEIYS